MVRRPTNNAAEMLDFKHALNCLRVELTAGRGRDGLIPSLTYAWTRFSNARNKLCVTVHDSALDADEKASEVFEQSIRVAAIALRMAVLAVSDEGREPEV